MVGPTAPRAQDPGPIDERGPARTLILTVTRRCDLRCAYCPTAKDGMPELSVADAVRAVDLFAGSYGGGDIKIFGGEPLLVPDVVRAATAAAAARPEIRRVYVSTNGLGLTDAWLDWVAAEPKAILTISMDGAPEDHRRFRKALPGVADAYAHLLTMMPRIVATPRVVITQTIPPATAHRAAENFEHLLGLGLRRFNLLPGYFIPWREDQLTSLRAGFTAIGDRVRAMWDAGEYLYLRNLFVWAPTPFFNTGLVVDSDASIHTSNVVLSGKLEELGSQTRLGSLDEPPRVEDLDAGAARTWDLLQQELPDKIVQSTRAADAALSGLVESLYGDWARWKRRRKQHDQRAAFEALPVLDPAPQGATPWIGPEGQVMRRLELHVTYHCPERCVFCSEDHRMRAFRSFPVTASRVGKVLRKHSQRGVHAVHLTGGEPTVHPQFVEILALAKGLGMRTSVGTIGTMLAREEFADRALPHLDEALFSLHGPTAEVHDALAGREGSFEQVTSALRLAVQGRPGFMAAVNTVVTRANIDLLPDTAALAASLGAQLLVVSNTTPEGAALDRYDELAVPLEDLARVLPHVPARAGDMVVRFFGVPMCLLGEHRMLSNDLHWDPRVTSEWARRPGKAVFEDFYNWRPDRKRTHVDACASCTMRRLCTGVYAEYAARRPTTALNPLVADAG
ncbi:MAG: radical SAM protein [Deltaproteobacteria bacterium]|nr:radical SAM protein [Deltaproteobacteria bacterium]